MSGICFFIQHREYTDEPVCGWGKEVDLEPDRKDETFIDKLTCDLAANTSKELRTKTVDIVTGKMEPLIEQVRRRDKDGKFYYESVIKEPGGRRKDLLETCVVDLLINGIVVKTVTNGKTEEPEE